MGHRVIVSSKARRDLRRIGAGSEARWILDKLVELGRDEQNLDVKALQGARPWLRLRVGDYRVLYALAPGDVYEIERIVHRRDLDSAAAGSASSSGNWGARNRCTSPRTQRLQVFEYPPGLRDVIGIGSESGGFGSQPLVLSPLRLVHQCIPDGGRRAAAVRREGRQRPFALVVRPECDRRHDHILRRRVLHAVDLRDLRAPNSRATYVPPPRSWSALPVPVRT